MYIPPLRKLLVRLIILVPLELKHCIESSYLYIVFLQGSFGKGSGDSETSMENCKNKDYKEIEEED